MGSACIPKSLPLLLQQVPYFQQLSIEVLEELAEIGSVQSWQDGRHVFRQGDHPDCMYLILKGSVAIEKVTAAGQVIPLTTANPGNFFGEMALIDGAPRSASVRTLAPSEFFVISREKFTALLSQCPHLIPGVLASIVGKLRNVNEQFLLEVCEKQKLRAEIIQERYRAISQIATAANEASSAEQAMQIVLDELCHYIRWPVGHVYVIDEQAKDRLFSSGIWHLHDPERYTYFRTATEMNPLTEGVGIPGRVLQKRKVVWAEDITRDLVSPRSPAALNCGLKSGFAFPVIVGKDVTAILEFYSDKPQENDRMLAEATQQIGAQLGRSIERKQLADRLAHNAFHDALTGLPNRVLFMDHLALSLGRTKRDPNYMFAVLFIDLDRFKWINDSLGHLAGDQLLKEIARRLTNCVRATDTVARLGGDEFGVLIDGLEQLSEVPRAIERIRTELQAPVPLKEGDISTCASIGIALSNTGYNDIETPLRDADTAMYRAKSKGPGNYAVFDPSMHESAVRRLTLDNDLRRAIERNELRLHYQPIVRTASSTVVGFEALIRWQHPTLGLLGPMDFLPIAEDTDLIIPITEWVMEESGRQVREWIQTFPTGVNFAVSTNLAPKYFIRRELNKRIKSLLTKHQFNARNLKLEITEGQIMEDPPAVARMILRLAELGIRVHIDDLGTGYSSLAYLATLRVDGLKIDRSFVSRIGGSERDSAIIRSIISLGQNLGLDVIAEGVETPAQRDFLIQADCKHAQGFLFSRPLEPHAATAYLGQNLFPDLNDDVPITSLDLGDLLQQS
ncbi:MAG: EAL domain-containing protein [Acidobacteria bacterium]|nr:EAL domain-containing protein [Acidobacteriota bacterium]